MRKLASIQRVWKIEPIEGADRIELAHVLGWQCVVRKGSFHPGDLAIYFEIDSFLPVRTEFEFLRDSCFVESPILGSGFRIKTRKMRGQVSQGLLLPLSLFPEVGEPILGKDVSEVLCVRKWEIEERATTGGTIIGTLPSSIPHTDETRIQAMPELLDQFMGKQYYITTKMDGSSHSVSIDEEGFHVTGHNYEYADDEKSSFYDFVKRHDLKTVMEKYVRENNIRTLAIQGEFCGPGIQGNPLRLIAPEWYVFTILVNGKRVGLEKIQEATKALDLQMVPVEEVGKDLLKAYPSVSALLSRAEGSYPNGGPKEGIVIRPLEPVFSPLISAPLSMKVINNEYLLRGKKK